MGPTIILDKSSLQALSQQELEFLYRYYTVNIPPILVIEILGDLHKPGDAGSLTGKDVQQLSNKLLQMDSAINHHYSSLLVNSLIGNDVISDGRPIVLADRVVRDKEGRRGVIFEQSAEEQAILRWRLGQFSDADRILSRRWRESTRQIDLNETAKKYGVFQSRAKHSKNLHELIAIIDELTVESGTQRELLTIMLYEFNIDPQTASIIFHRWENNTDKLIRDFAPYAFFVFRITLVFYIGLLQKFIGTRSTNRIDLEYTYYLPFTKIFCSRDHFHISFVPEFLQGNQKFLLGDELKQDLKNIVNELDVLNGMEREEWLKKNGHCPPEQEDSVTNQMWQIYRKPTRGIGKNLEQKIGIVNKKENTRDRINGYINEDTFIEPNVKELDEKNIDFMVRERTITDDDPCPCQSGRKFKDCHLPEVLRKQSK
jgi:hypothetical protein